MIEDGSVSYAMGSLVKCISDEGWTDPLSPEVGEILRIDGIGLDADGAYLSFETSVDFYIASNFRPIVHTYKPAIGWREDWAKYRSIASRGK